MSQSISSRLAHLRSNKAWRKAILGLLMIALPGGLIFAGLYFILGAIKKAQANRSSKKEIESDDTQS